MTERMNKMIRSGASRNRAVTGAEKPERDPKAEELKELDVDELEARFSEAATEVDRILTEMAERLRGESGREEEQA